MHYGENRPDVNNWQRRLIPDAGNLTGNLRMRGLPVGRLTADPRYSSQFAFLPALA